MLELRKITSRLVALGVLLSCLVFTTTASFTETASASQLVFCQSCVPVSPHMEVYCSWYVINDCATEAPLKNTLNCLPPAPSCLP